MKEDCLYKEVCTDECGNLCVRYSQMKYMLDHSNLPKSQRCIHKLKAPSCDIAAFDKLKNIQDYIDEFVEEGHNLYLWSTNVGNGKTTWSIKLLMQYFDSVWEYSAFNQMGIFINVPTYLMRCKNNISTPDEGLPDIQNGLLNAPLAVFDDVIVSKLSSYDYTNLEGYIDARLFEKRSMIFTGNYSPNELEQLVGKRLRSRICSDVVIELKGKDMRAQ